MHRPWLLVWLAHCLATIGGWYTLAALAQGVADSSAAVPLALTLLDAAVSVLCFPGVLAAIELGGTRIGEFTVASFSLFATAAALNSAAVVALIALGVRAVRSLRGESESAH